MIPGGYVVGAARRDGDTQLTVASSADGHACRAYQSEAAVLCRERPGAPVKLGDAVRWEGDRLLWTPMSGVRADLPLTMIGRPFVPSDRDYKH